MQQKKIIIQWAGSFIELCIGRLTQAQKCHLDAHCTDLERDFQSSWYRNTGLLQSLFNVDNWWSVDDLDRAMGLVFKDRSAIETKLATMTVEFDGTPATIDPEALQLSYYAPETIDPLNDDGWAVCHGTRRGAVLRLEADVEPPLDPSLITLSFLHYPDYGYILIDMDYDGHDDVQFTLGETTYLRPRLFRKDHIDDASR